MDTFDPDAYLEQTGPVATRAAAPAKGGFDPDTYLEQTGGVAGAIENIPKDIGGMLKGSAELAGRTAKGVLDLPGDIDQTAEDVISGKNPADTPLAQDVKTVGKTAAGMVTGIPKQIANLGKSEEWIEHPVGNALTASAIVAPFMGGEEAIAKEGAEAGAALPKAPPPEVPEEIFAKPEVPAEADDAALRSKAQQNLGNANEAPGASSAAGNSRPSGPPVTEKPGPLEDLINQIKIPERVKGVPGEVKDFVNRKLAKPETAPVVSKYMKDFADQMALKDFGASPMQIRALDPTDPTFPKAHAMAEWLQDKKLVDPTIGPIGQRELVKQIGEEAGDTIGKLREAATKAGPEYNTKALLQNIINRLGKKYTYGVNKGDIGEFQKALETVANAEPTPAGLAESATQLNKDMQVAHGLNRAHGPYQEVADYISKLNNDVIRQRLGEKALDYNKALIDFGASKKTSQFARMKGSKELSGRGGSVGSLTNRVYQTALDKVGYRAAGKVAGRMSKAIEANPAIAHSMADLFTELANQVEDLMAEKD